MPYMIHDGVVEQMEASNHSENCAENSHVLEVNTGIALNLTYFFDVFFANGLDCQVGKGRNEKNQRENGTQPSEEPRQFCRFGLILEPGKFC